MRLRRKPWIDQAIHDFDDFVFPKDSPASEAQKGEWHSLFGSEKPLYVELGTGKGDFISQLAEREQEMENSKRTASVQATGTIYPGVVVNIWREAMAIKQETVSAKFTLSSKGVRMEGI